MSPSPEIEDCYLKNIFPNMLSSIPLDFISNMEVTDHKHYINDIENKIDNFQLQECSLKHRSFWKLLISLETYTE